VKRHFQRNMAKVTFHLVETTPASARYQVDVLQFDIALYANSNAVLQLRIFCENEIEY
jgi:hypothetical protein